MKKEHYFGLIKGFQQNFTEKNEKIFDRILDRKK